MKAIALLLLFTIILLETIEQLSFADGARRTSKKWAIWSIGFVAHGLGIAVWMPTLTMVPVSVALPLTGLCYVSTSLAAGALLGEKVTRRRWTAIMIIVFGAFLIYQGGGVQ